MRRRWLTLLLGSGAIAALMALTWSLRSVVSLLVIGPALNLLWLARVIYGSLPQQLLWIFFLALAALVSARTVLRQVRTRGARRTVIATERGQIETWARTIRFASESRYSRWRLARELAEQAIVQLAFQLDRPAAAVRADLASGALELPAGVGPYLRAGLTATPPARRRWLGLLAAGGDFSDLDLDPAQVVEYLEGQWNQHG